MNRTYITVDGYNLSIEHRPLKNPFKPAEEIPVQDIDQIYVRRHVVSTTNGKSSYGHSVMAVLKNGRQLKLRTKAQEYQKQSRQKSLNLFIDWSNHAIEAQVEQV